MPVRRWKTRERGDLPRRPPLFSFYLTLYQRPSLVSGISANHPTILSLHERSEKSMIVYVEACGCTQACRHCAVDGKPPYGAFYALAELRALREEWGPLVPYYESTVHPEFPEIMYPKIMGEGSNMLATNGFGLARRDDCKEIFQKLKGAGYWGLSLTLHGLKENHDLLVSHKGAVDDILTATRKAAEADFGVHWNFYLNRENLAEVPAVIELSKKELGGAPWIGIPSHRVSRRMWRYEKFRPSLREVRGALSDELIAQTWKQPLEEFTEESWLRAWRQSADGGDFRDHFESEEWPPAPPFERMALFFTREREVFIDPRCGPRILLGELVEGREELLSRLQGLPMPEGADLRAEDARLRERDAELLHSKGSSVRYKAISTGKFGAREETIGD